MQVSTLVTKAQHDACVEAIRRAFAKTLRAREPLTGSQWADRHFYLSSETGSEQRWTTNSLQVGMLDVMCADEPRTVSVLKCARMGYTKMLDATAAYNLEHKRRNTLIYQPTDSDAADFCKSEIDPMLRDVPVLAALAAEGTNAKRDDTLRMKKLGAKVLYIMGGNSEARYRRLSVDTVIYDELDGFDLDIGGDAGDPISLGDARNTNATFPKSIRGSTPLLKHNSLITKEAGRAKFTFRFLVRCPECDTAQPLTWQQMAFDKEGDAEARAATARHLCSACSVSWHYSDLMTLLESGRWCTEDGHQIRTGDGDPLLVNDLGEVVDWPRHVAFQVWAGYSPYMSWADLVFEWLEAQGDEKKLKTFTQQRFGEAWEDKAQSLDENDLFQRRQIYKVPTDILAILASVDVQDNRVEIEVAGFGDGEHAWHLEHRVIYGDTESLDSPVWSDLTTALRSCSYIRDDGLAMTIDAMGLDTGFRTETCYRYLTRTPPLPRSYALKGIPGEKRAIVGPPSRQKTLDGLPIDLFGVGADTAKALVVNRLGVKATAPFRLGMNVTFEQCLQLTAEKRVTKFKMGYAVKRWVKVRDRNEMFDLLGYLYVVLYIVNPVWAGLREQREKQLNPPAAPPAAQPKPARWATNW